MLKELNLNNLIKVPFIQKKVEENLKYKKKKKPKIYVLCHFLSYEQPTAYGNAFEKKVKLRAPWCIYLTQLSQN
jgi:hypothetical protein